MELTLLKSYLDDIDRISDTEWKSSLSSRKIKELEFHDRDRDASRIEQVKNEDTYEKFYGNKKYYSTTQRSRTYTRNWIEDECQDKIFLDYACGNGANALHAANSGALLALGLDISSVSVLNARKASENIGNIRFIQADAENTKLPDNSIDRIICSGMLHHLDLSYAFPELRRILKPGGKLLAIEALDYNPAIKFYRMMTPDMRTEWEKAHILSLRDLDFAKRFFEIGEVKYWHVVGYAAAKFKMLGNSLEIVDRFLENLPYIQRMAWTFTFELIKPTEK